VKNSWWLAGWPAGTTPALECLGLACSRTEVHFSSSPGTYGAGSKAECQEALIRLPAVGLYA